VRVIFTPLAERNINSLHEYIAEHTSEERADGYVGRIVDFCNGLSTFPLRGTQRDDLLSGLRVTGFERRVTIAFIVTADAVLIEGISMAAGTSRRSSAIALESLEAGEISLRSWYSASCRRRKRFSAAIAFLGRMSRPR
jgi:toxin ParE1/3/4